MATGEIIGAGAGLRPGGYLLRGDLVQRGALCVYAVVLLKDAASQRAALRVFF